MRLAKVTTPDGMDLYVNPQSVAMVQRSSKIFGSVFLINHEGKPLTVNGPLDVVVTELNAALSYTGTVSAFS